MDPIEKQIKNSHKESVEDARMMRDFVNTDVGRQFETILKQSYESMVTKACEESQYAGALTAIENMASKIGTTLTRGESARDILERLTKQSPVEEW